MKRNITILLTFVICVLHSTAQQRDRFSLNIAETYPVVQNSLYSTISFMDSRLNKTQNQYLVNAELISRELSALLDKSIDGTAQNRSMLFQLRDLSFETDGNKGFSHIRVSLYESDNSQYFMIGTLDTDVQIQVNTNLSNRLQQEVSATIISFVADNLQKPYIDVVPYTLDDVRHIDSVEKESTQLFNDDVHKDGVYYTFESFMAQEPLVTKMEVRFKKDKLSEIRLIDRTSNKFKKIDPASIYAVVLDGQAYVTFDKKYCPLYFDNGNLLFDAEHKSSNVGFAPSFSMGIGSGGYRGGGIGLGVFTQSKKETVTYMIDHLNGNFIPIKQ